MSQAQWGNGFHAGKKSQEPIIAVVGVVGAILGAVIKGAIKK